MKTYNSIYMLLALLIVGCSTSDEGLGGEEKQKKVDADYVILLTKDNNLTTQFLNSNDETIVLNLEESSLAENKLPQLTSIRGTTFFQYHRKNDCGGKITKHDFNNDKTEEIDMFEDLNDCQLTANAIAFTDASLFLAYESEVDSKTVEYNIRVVDLNSTNFGHVDVSLNKKPVDLALANNRLFVLTLDVEVSGENFISVLDLDSNSLIHEMSLGSRARRIFPDTDDDVIISYDELHTTLNSSNMAVVYTNYGKGTEPRFTSDTANNFDLEGRLYYPIVSGTVSSYPVIPAVYDFDLNLTTLYAFENFLTEAKRDFEFEIETTTAVNFDTKNNMMLIGYKKKDRQEGGLIRIKPAPEPAFVDNIDLDGVPYEILIN
jgi:hypothetical protein